MKGSCLETFKTSSIKRDGKEFTKTEVVFEGNRGGYDNNRGGYDRNRGGNYNSDRKGGYDNRNQRRPDYRNRDDQSYQTPGAEMIEEKNKLLNLALELKDHPVEKAVVLAKELQDKWLKKREVKNLRK